MLRFGYDWLVPMKRAAVSALGVLLAAANPACRGPSGQQARASACPPVTPAPAASVAARPVGEATGTAAGAEPGEAPPRPLRRCFSEQPAWVDAAVADLLDHAADLFDAGDYPGALACAEEAARQAPRSVEAHHNRAVALLHLDRLDEARDALALALALAPDDPETLEAAADLNINQLPPSADRSAIGLEYARRGSHHLPRRDPERHARLALLEGQALIDLGRSAEALRRIDAALAAAPHMVPAQYERGVALFELCRFTDARRTFEKVLASVPDHAHALYHLGLIEERLGEEATSTRHLAEATSREPKAFPPPPEVSSADFAARVRRAVAGLPADVRRDLSGIEVESAELPALDDLVAEKPPLSPTILGLFRGLPLDWNEHASTPPTQAGRAGKGHVALSQAGAAEAPSPPPAPHCAGPDQTPDRAIVLYRRNLLRTVRDLKELDQAIVRTLLHEVGHLRGEDDGSLRDRGLE
jgi:tetratricopeptide (TPR) repeat protein